MIELLSALSTVDADQDRARAASSGEAAPAHSIGASRCIGDLDSAAFRRKLRRGFAFDFGMARVKIRSDVAPFAEALQCVYRAFPADDSGSAFFDVEARLLRTRSRRRPWIARTEFELDGLRPFDPLAADSHLPMFEWSLNWCFATRFHRHVLLHSGVVARDDAAVVIPAVPGTGKSTLTAALVCRGYRLLSDEFGAIDDETKALVPVVRPIALKNESIEVIRRFAPDAVLGPVFRNTRKGDVAHVAPDPRSVAQRDRRAQPRLVIFPRYEAGSDLQVASMPQALSFIKLASNSFNYELTGPRGFDAVRHLVRNCRCYELRYSDLESAVEAIDGLLNAGRVA